VSQLQVPRLSRALVVPMAISVVLMVLAIVAAVLGDDAGQLP